LEFSVVIVNLLNVFGCCWIFEWITVYKFYMNMC